jgi:hypothetical protein
MCWAAMSEARTITTPVSAEQRSGGPALARQPARDLRGGQRHEPDRPHGDHADRHECHREANEREPRPLDVQPEPVRGVVAQLEHAQRAAGRDRQRQQDRKRDQERHDVVPGAPVERIVSVGFTEHDTVLALGEKPIATSEWYGDQPYATWPWARDELGSSKPTVLNNGDGFEYEKIAARSSRT